MLEDILNIMNYKLRIIANMKDYVIFEDSAIIQMFLFFHPSQRIT